MFFKDDIIEVVDRGHKGRIEKISKTHYFILWDGHKNPIGYKKESERFWEISKENPCVHVVKKLQKGRTKNDYIFCEKCGKSRIY